MILTLEDKRQAKVNHDLIKIEFALLVIRANKYSRDAYL